MMRVNRYHMPAMNLQMGTRRERVTTPQLDMYICRYDVDTDLVDRAFGATSQPIHITAAQAHQKAWLMYKL